MIDIKIKPCCVKCQTPDLSIDSSLFYAGEKNETVQTVCCIHQHVCKTYLESGTYASIINGFDVK